MLEIKNLVKCYSTKGGVTVKALDNVSVKFPETGMVFLLGRSGSGKSTLLNVSGGLDKPDSGEIIVKGRSSKDFSSADFDSYRNTCIGFIFQEYNILNEFNVEQNIALALQLQGKPNDKKAVNDLLEQVDLKGLGKRKPNTLSGGQKQRVAIARALIKNPEIIMADEPTGALDSNTGKQVLDTLKKLSTTKLVVIVSHDREFAEFYGDRIIELKDGQILSDVSKEISEPRQINENVQIISDDTISIKNAEEITETDVKNIVTMLKKNKGEAIITAGKREMPDVKRACKINDNGNKEYFADTKNVDVKEYDGKKTKFIKSKLPASHAFKMGASGLKTKPIRLIFTILLSVIAFVLFGVVSTFMLYDSNYSVSEALREANYPSITVEKKYLVKNQNYKVDNVTGEEKLDYEREEKYTTRFGVQELKNKNASANGVYAGIYNFTNDRWSNGNQGISLMFVNDNPISPDVGTTLKDYYPVDTIYGFTDCGAEYMQNNGFTFIGEGRYPENKTEIAIPEYIANLFVETERSGVTEASQLVGKQMKFTNCNAIPSSDQFTIVGVYKINEIPSKYDTLKDSTNTQLSSTEKELLKSSLKDFIEGSFNDLVFVSEDFYDQYKNNISTNGNSININSYYARGVYLNQYEITEDYQDWWGESVYTEKTIKDYKKYVKLYDLDGNEINSDNFTLSDHQIFISKSILNEKIRENLRNNYINHLTGSLKGYDAQAKELFNLDFQMQINELYMLSDLSGIIAVVNEWYPVLKEKEYLVETYNALYAYYHDELPTDLKEAGNKIVSNVNNNTPENIQESDWTTLKTWIDANLKTNYEQIYYYDYALEMYYHASERQSELNQLITSGTDIWNVINSMRYNNADTNDYNAIKNAILNGKYREFVGHDIKEGADRFIPNLSVDIEKIYYKNFAGLSGELEVLGYFDIEGQPYVQSYLVSDNFRRTYSQLYDGEEEYTWKYIESTEYVEPEDAKYNYIIRLTDNSIEQITEALTGGTDVVLRITNNVYTQLEFFVEMITELEQIFLIIGIVMGVFSALMLLNFISVSISAKRKEIGVLRAVGARGSDVFKIFFAEAFIIALICFIIATVVAYVVCSVLNTSMVTVVNMKLLNFQAINVLLILAVSFGISVVATFFPVYFTAKKPPVESIRAL